MRNNIVIVNDLNGTCDFNRVLNLARDLARDLNRTGDLARTCARDRAHNLVRDLDRTRDLARDRAHSRTFDLASDLAHARIRTLALTRELTHARELTHVRTGNLDRSLSLACDLARDLTHARARNLIELAIEANDRAVQLARALESLTAAQESEYAKLPAKSVVRPGRSAQRLIEAGVRLLPITHRARYNEEYSAELYELAKANASRRVQVAYATRLLIRVIELRIELRHSARRRVVSS